MHLVLDTGFAFSQEAGNDRLVTDNLSNRLKEALAKQLFNNKQFLMQSKDLDEDAPKVLTAVPNLIKQKLSNKETPEEPESKGYDINASTKLDDNNNLVVPPNGGQFEPVREEDEQPAQNNEEF